METELVNEIDFGDTIDDFAAEKTRPKPVERVD